MLDQCSMLHANIPNLWSLHLFTGFWSFASHFCLLYNCNWIGLSPVSHISPAIPILMVPSTSNTTTSPLELSPVHLPSPAAMLPRSIPWLKQGCRHLPEREWWWFWYFEHTSQENMLVSAELPVDISTLFLEYTKINLTSKHLVKSIKSQVARVPDKVTFKTTNDNMAASDFCGVYRWWFQKYEEGNNQDLLRLTKQMWSTGLRELSWDESGRCCATKLPLFCGVGLYLKGRRYVWLWINEHY